MIPPKPLFRTSGLPSGAVRLGETDPGRTAPVLILLPGIVDPSRYAPARRWDPPSRRWPPMPFEPFEEPPPEPQPIHEDEEDGGVDSMLVGLMQ